MTRLRRTCLALALVGACWALVIWAAGGILVHVGGLRISSRSVRNPLLGAALGATLAWALAPAASRRQALATDLAALGAALPAWTASARLPAIVATVAAVAVLAAGILGGAFAAGGSDSYGYVSQARMWTEGRLQVDEPLMRQFPEYGRAVFTPLGWRPAIEGDAIVPSYPAGYPLLMSLFERIGGADAVYLVVPAMAALAVWATFLLGRATAGAAVGAAAAVLLATSPAFLVMVASPMSDVPAAAWWAVSLAGLTSGRRPAALAAGLATGAAILTRPNLVPLIAAPALLLLWPMVRHRNVDRTALTRVVAYGSGVIAACAGVAALNAQWFGSPLRSGHGTLGDLFSLTHVATNLTQFGTWLVETQTPLVALACAGPWLVRWTSAIPNASPTRRSLGWMCAGFAALTLGCYLVYFPFPEWWNLRFLLPAYPALMILLATTLAAATARLPGIGRPLLAVAVSALAAHGLTEARERQVFDTRGAMSYAEAGRWARELPPRSIALAQLHSGSVRHYAGLPSIRWDLLAPHQLDPLIATLHGRGYHPVLVLADGEQGQFEGHFADASAYAKLDWAPTAHLSGGLTTIFALPPPGASPATTGGSSPANMSPQ